MAGPGDNEAAVIEFGDRWVLLLSGSGIDNCVIAVPRYAIAARIDQELINTDNRRINRVVVAIRRRKGLGKNVVARSITGTFLTVRILPGHDKPVAMRRNRGMILRSTGVAVHQELSTHFRTMGIIALAVDIGAAAGIRITGAAIIRPDNDKPAVLQRRDLWVVLRTADVGVD